MLIKVILYRLEFLRLNIDKFIIWYQILSNSPKFYSANFYFRYGISTFPL